MGDRNFKSFPVLKTERLTLRQLESSDANEIFALRSNDNVNKYLSRKWSQSIDDAMTFIQTIPLTLFFEMLAQRISKLGWSDSPNRQ